MMRWQGAIQITVAVLVLSLGVVSGCAVDAALTTEQAEVAASQKYDYDYVKRQSRQLTPGLSKAEVMILLGSPAQQEAARWVYLPKRPGVFVPAEALVVQLSAVVMNRTRLSRLYLESV